MKKNFIHNIQLEEFDLNPSDFHEINPNQLLIKKWNWDYEKSHKFQKYCVSYLANETGKRIFIICNHPRVLTNGRGLQKAKKGQTLNLQEFILKSHDQLPFPLHQIERGGGLTFHHPGQFIFYPIVKLNPKTLSLSKMIDDIFEMSISVLNRWGVQNAHHQHELLGLWHEEQKLASMGIAIEKLTTFHGMALNILKDTEMMAAMRALNPCGLSSGIYKSLEEIIKLPNDPIEKFSLEFLNEVSKTWN